LSWYGGSLGRGERIARRSIAHNGTYERSSESVTMTVGSAAPQCPHHRTTR
jgi:hypothetical protein